MNIPPMLDGAAPLFGHALQFNRDRQALFRRGYEKHGGAFAIRLVRQPAAVLIGPGHHETFFGETDKKLNMSKPYRFLAAAFGDIGFAASYQTYVEQRPILHAPFKAARMPGYLGIMRQEVQLFIDGLRSDGELELTTSLNRVVQNIAAHCLMGKAFREQAGDEFWRQYAILGKALDPLLPPNLPLPKFIRRDIARRKLRAMMQPIVDDRRAHPGRHDDFLEEMLQAKTKSGSALDDGTVIGMVLALMFAGHETTVGQAAWTLIQVLQHPDYRKRLEEEVLAVGPEPARLPLTLNAVHETTRLKPSADILLRYVESDLEAGPWTIPAGWVVFVSPGVAHQTALFKNPRAFEPDRFETEEHDRFAMIGFGAGIHKCAGMHFANNEMAIIAAMLFAQLDLQLVTKSPRQVLGLGAARPSRTVLRYRKRVTSSRGTATRPSPSPALSATP